MDPGVFDPDRFRDEPTMTVGEVVERARVDLETAKRTWRALGFPDADDDEVAFDERDLESLRSLSALVSFGFPLEDLITMARTCTARRCLGSPTPRPACSTSAS